MPCHMPYRWKLNSAFIPDEFGFSQRQTDEKDVAEKEKHRK